MKEKTDWLAGFAIQLSSDLWFMVYVCETEMNFTIYSSKFIGVPWTILVADCVKIPTDVVPPPRLP